MATCIIKKKAGTTKSLKGATARMDWRGFVIAGDQVVNHAHLQDGFSANLEYCINEGDEIVEVDEAGVEIGRVIFD